MSETHPRFKLHGFQVDDEHNGNSLVVRLEVGDQAEQLFSLPLDAAEDLANVILLGVKVCRRTQARLRRQEREKRTRFD